MKKKELEKILTRYEDDTEIIVRDFVNHKDYEFKVCVLYPSGNIAICINKETITYTDNYIT